MQVTERQAGDVAELARLAKRETKAAQRDRYRAVLMAIEGQGAPAIATTLARPRRHVQDWVYAYRDGGIEQLQPKPRPGRPTKLPREREAQLRARLEGQRATAESVRNRRVSVSFWRRAASESSRSAASAESGGLK